MPAANVSPNTIRAHGAAVRQFGQWLMARSYPTDLRAIEPRHVDEPTGVPKQEHIRLRQMDLRNLLCSLDDQEGGGWVVDLRILRLQRQHIDELIDVGH